MIYFGEGSKSPYAKIWEITEYANYAKAKISTSKKNKDGTYENSNWFCSFLGKSCLDKVKEYELEKGDTIIIKSGNISMQKGNTDDKKFFVNMVIFDFEIPDNAEKQANKTTKKDKPVEDSEEEILPF